MRLLDLLKKNCSLCSHTYGNHTAAGECRSGDRTGVPCSCVNLSFNYTYSLYGGKIDAEVTKDLEQLLVADVQKTLISPAPVEADQQPLVQTANRTCPLCRTSLTWEDRSCWRCAAWGVPER